MGAESFSKSRSVFCTALFIFTLSLFVQEVIADDTDTKARFDFKSSSLTKTDIAPSPRTKPGGVIILNNSIVPGGLEQKVTSFQDFKTLEDLEEGKASAIYSSSYFNKVFKSSLSSSRTPTVSSGFPYTEMAMLPGEGCDEVSVELLATEITWGSQGPDVPLLIDWLTEGNTRTTLFGGQDLQEVQIGTIDIPRDLPGGEIDWIGRSAYPNFEDPDPIFSMEIESAHPNNAAILINASNLYEVAAAKGIQDPFGGQLELEQVLVGHINEQTGDVSLGLNEMLILYELGTTNQQSQAFDFQDLVVMVKFNPECVVMEVDHLRKDELGKTATCWDEQTEECTDGHKHVPNTALTNGDEYGIVGIRVHIPESTVVTGFNGVGGSAGPFWSFSTPYTAINIHSSEEAFADQPQLGDVYQTDQVTLVDDPPSLFGGDALGGIFPYYYVEFAFDPFVLPSGDYIFSFDVHTSGSFNWAETATDLGSDIWTAFFMPGVYQEIDSMQNMTTGTAAIDIKGYPLP